MGSPAAVNLGVWFNLRLKHMLEIDWKMNSGIPSVMWVLYIKYHENAVPPMKHLFNTQQIMACYVHRLKYLELPTVPSLPHSISWLGRVPMVTKKWCPFAERHPDLTWLIRVLPNSFQHPQEIGKTSYVRPKSEKKSYSKILGPNSDPPKRSPFWLKKNGSLSHPRLNFLGSVGRDYTSKIRLINGFSFPSLHDTVHRWIQHWNDVWLVVCFAIGTKK